MRLSVILTFGSKVVRCVLVLLFTFLMKKSADGGVSGEGDGGKTCKLNAQYFKREFAIFSNAVSVGKDFDLDPTYQELNRFSSDETISVFDVLVEIGDEVKQLLVRIELGDDLVKPNIAGILSLKVLQNENEYRERENNQKRGNNIVPDYFGIVRNQVRESEFKAVVSGIRIFLFSILSFDPDHQIRSKRLSMDALNKMKEKCFSDDDFTWETYVLPILSNSFSEGECDASILSSLSHILAGVAYNDLLDDRHKCRFEENIAALFNDLSEYFWGIDNDLRNNANSCYGRRNGAINLFYKIQIGEDLDSSSKRILPEKISFGA